VAAPLVAREFGGGRRAETVAAVVVGFSPLLLATDGLFQPSRSTAHHDARAVDPTP